MKKIVFLLSAMLISIANMASAGVFTIDPDGAGAATAVQASSFDWAVGNALSIGSTKAISNGGGINNPFQTVYQARLGSFINPQGVAFTTPGLNTAYELTIVASIPEYVQFSAGGFTSFGIANGANFAAFDPLGRAGTQIPNFIEVYASPVNASDLQGTGFNDGVLVMAGAINPGGFSNFQVQFNPNGTPVTQTFDQFGGPAGTGSYPGYQTLVGAGTTFISSSISFVNTAFFPGFQPGVGLDLQFFNTSQVDPFAQQAPSLRFSTSSGGAATAIGANPGNRTTGGINGTGTLFGSSTGTDFQFQADGNSTIDIAQLPEPTGMLIWSIGGLGLCFLRRRSA